MVQGEGCTGFQVCEFKIYSHKNYMCTGRLPECAWTHFSTDSVVVHKILSQCAGAACGPGLFLPVLVGTITPGVSRKGQP